MVCIYCGHSTSVVNSRHQKLANHVWRRRKCVQCQAIFTTLEAIDTSQALRIQSLAQYQPFSRDTLFISIYESLRHRKTAQSDATALTETVLSRTYPSIHNAVVDRDILVAIVIAVLERFDAAAATSYQAFHPLRQDQVAP